MKKYKTIYLFICLLYVYNYVHAQNEVASPRIMQYVQEHKDMAIEEMLRTGVPASITLAQDILESNCGESELCKISHNHFGIKCKNNWTGPTVLYDDDKPNECFRVYTSDIDSYRDHSNFIRNRPYYASLFDINPIEYKQWAMALQQCGYATSSTYGEELIHVIETYHLQQYTLDAIEKKYTSTMRAIPTSYMISNHKRENIEDTTNDLKKPINQSALYPSDIFRINRLKVVYALPHTTLLFIASKYNISLVALLKINELPSTKQWIDTGQLIFLQYKKRKGNKDTHLVKPFESLYDISQEEGVLLSSLEVFNRIPHGYNPAVGENIYLRYNSPTTPKLTQYPSR